MKIVKFGLIFIGLVSLVFVAIQITPNLIEKRNRKKKAELLINYYQNKTMTLPFYENDSLSRKEFDQLYTNQPLKIADFLNGDCSFCFEKLSFWKKFLDELAADGHDVPILIYSNSFNKEHLVPEINASWRYPWVFDTENLFIKYNELIDRRFQTILLDGKNKVLVIGDPYSNEELRTLFLKTIKKHR